MDDRVLTSKAVPVASGSLAHAEATLAVVDAQTIQRLRDLARTTDPALFAAVVQAFLSDAARHLRTLHAAATTGDARGLTVAAHALKGSSAQVGASRVNALASELEYLGASGTVADGAAVIERLDRAWDAASGALQRLIGGAAA